MSDPEWMNKYNQIGQRGEEAVTTTKDGGIDTSPVMAARESTLLDATTAAAIAGALVGSEAQDSSAGEEAPAPAAPAQPPKPKTGGFLFGGGGAEKKEESTPEETADGDADAAALLTNSGGEAPAADSTPVADSTADDDADAAAMFANVGGEAPAGDDAAAAFANAGGDEEVVEEEVVEEEVVEAGDDDKKAVSDWRRQRDEEGQESAAESEQPREYPVSPPIDDNDNWVPDKQQQGEQSAEEILVDEDGIEIIEEVEDVLVDEDGNEIVEEEAVLVDEDGNEIIEEVTEAEDIPIVDEDGNEIVEEDEEVHDDIPVEDEERDLSRDLEMPPAPIDLEAQRALINKIPQKDRSFMSSFIPCFVFIITVVTIVLITLVVFDLDGDDSISAPSTPPTTELLLLGPTNIGLVDVAETTPLAAVTGNCNFDNLEQPHFIDQCACGVTINKIADDVLARYETLVPWMRSMFDDWDESSSSCSARNQALVWLSSGVNLGGEISLSRRADRYLSTLLYIQAQGQGWTDKENWISEESICKWKGVFCDDQESLIGIDLQDNNLKGQLSVAAGMYEFLEFISVRRNQLNGTIPQDLFASKTLRSIDLYDNSFYGEIPSFDTDIPLETLHVGKNRLSGLIYESIGNAKSLKRLDLSNNQLNGNIPKVLFDLALEELDIHTNLLTGTIHTEIGSVTTLTELNLGGNGFTGSLPVQLGSLTNLQELVVRDAPNIAGRIPASYGLALRNLVKVIISGTSIDSNIPETFGNIRGLEHMDFSKNRLRGNLSSELGLLSNLKVMNLFDNNIAGSIPTEFGQLAALTELFLEDNNITGEIPDELSSLSRLQQLTLQGNSMSGRSPHGVCDLRGSGLNVFVVDCPVRIGDGFSGVLCDTPQCCTSCR